MKLTALALSQPGTDDTLKMCELYQFASGFPAVVMLDSRAATATVRAQVNSATFSQPPLVTDMAQFLCRGPAGKTSIITSTVLFY